VCVGVLLSPPRPAVQAVTEGNWRGGVQPSREEAYFPKNLPPPTLNWS